MEAMIDLGVGLAGTLVRIPRPPRLKPRCRRRRSSIANSVGVADRSTFIKGTDSPFPALRAGFLQGRCCGAFRDPDTRSSVKPRPAKTHLLIHDAEFHEIRRLVAGRTWRLGGLCTSYCARGFGPRSRLGYRRLLSTFTADDGRLLDEVCRPTTCQRIWLFACSTSSEMLTD